MYPLWRGLTIYFYFCSRLLSVLTMDVEVVVSMIQLWSLSPQLVTVYAMREM